MIAHKNITKVIAVVMAAAVCLCLCAEAFSGRIAAAAGDTGVCMEYETALFDTGSIISVNILMDEDSWNEMLQNATEEKYYQCDVEINGTTFYRVGIRPKGNTSITSIANDPTTDRYSFKLEFDHYVDGQTCFGLDKLILNNNYADATNMKEALIYDMYQYLGADASLYNYAKISVNGAYWGVYLALEAVEDSFLLRNFGTARGALYKPDSMNMGGGGGRDFGAGDFDGKSKDFGDRTMPDIKENSSAFDLPEAPTQTSADETASEETGADGPAGETSSFSERPEKNGDFGGGPGGFSMGGGADLNYTDDELDSYETIWDGEVTDTTKADHKRVVAALKNISEGNDLEDYMDIDNLLRYMAVHIFSVNEDSLSGTMAHNYYLCESGGRLNILPWDYNLTLGGMGGGKDAESIVNAPIDDAFESTQFFDTLMENETYHSWYYACLQQLVSEYIDGGGFDAFYARVRGQIDELVETDPTAFYTYEEYLAAVDTLYQTVKLRGQSIQGQLDGTIPSTEEEQRSSDALVDASELDISAMGGMNTGGGPAFGGHSGGDNQTAPERTQQDLAPEDAQQLPQMPPQMPPQKPSDSDDDRSAERPDMGNFPGENDNGAEKTVSSRDLALYAGTGAVLLVSLLFAVLYHRRPRRR